MKILITGGAGYIGTKLTKELIKDDKVSEIVIYDNLSSTNYNLFLGEKFKHKDKLTFILGDVLDSRGLESALKGVDIVYHLAAKVTTPFSNTDSHFYEQTNHWGTAELTYALESSDVKKLIYVSSASVYGSSSKVINEDTIPNPRTFYGISKLRGEEHVMRLMDKMDTYILRCGNVFGYSHSMRFDAVINKFMFDANFNNKISIHGNGKQSRPFIHVNKVASVLKNLPFSKAPSGVYNVVGQTMTILDIVDVLKEIYPELEFIFINQHLKLREINIDAKSKLEHYLTIPHDGNFKEELMAFKSSFSF